MFRRAIRTSVIAGLVISLLLAVAMTFWDWWLNPSAVFRDTDATGFRATHWPVVVETFWSWLWPSVLVFIPVVCVLILVFVRVRAAFGNSSSQ